MERRNRDLKVENKHIDTRGREEAMNWKTGIDVYTLLILRIKYMTGENLLYSTGNSTQGSVVAYTGKKYKKKYMSRCN